MGIIAPKGHGVGFLPGWACLLVAAPVLLPQDAIDRIMYTPRRQWRAGNRRGKETSIHALSTYERIYVWEKRTV
jgi:hypothetical protein